MEEDAATMLFPATTVFFPVPAMLFLASTMFKAACTLLDAQKHCVERPGTLFKRDPTQFTVVSHGTTAWEGLRARTEKEKGRAHLSGPGVTGYGKGRLSMPSSAGRRQRG